MLKTSIHDLLSVARELAAALMPGALGATVSVAMQTGLTWVQRFLQIAVGITVSYYAGEVAAHVFGLPDMVKSGVGFVSGLAAFELVKNIKQVASRAPQDVWDNIKSWFGRKP